MTREELQKERQPRSIIHQLVVAGVKDGAIFRRFAVRCAWGVMFMAGDDPRCREALEVAKRHSTGEATADELAAAAEDAAAARDEAKAEWLRHVDARLHPQADTDIAEEGRKAHRAFATYLARQAVWAATKPAGVFAAYWAADYAQDAMVYNTASSEVFDSLNTPYVGVVGYARCGAERFVAETQCQFLRECLTWEAIGKLCGPEFATA